MPPAKRARTDGGADARLDALLSDVPPGKLEESSLDILSVAKDLHERSMKLSVPPSHSSTALHIDSSEGSLVFTKSKSWYVHVEAHERT